jgi:hypothetical protein
MMPVPAISSDVARCATVSSAIPSLCHSERCRSARINKQTIF